MAYNILIVDDSPLLRGVIRRNLGLSGLDLGAVYEAGNGRDALAVLDANWIDLVLADLNMPEVDGFAMIDEISRTPAYQGVAVIVISTEGSGPRLEALHRQGVLACLRKPFTPEQFTEVIRQSLSEDRHD